MNTIIQSAIRIRKAHIKCGMPMVLSQGFKEVNIAFAMCEAFRKAGYFCFPEFPLGRGSIDAVFVRKCEVIVCEWKQLCSGTAPVIVEQSKRMLQFDASREMAKHSFAPCSWKTRRLWVCDTWEMRAADWWLKRSAATICTPNPFDSEWTVGSADFPSFGSDWNPYSWVWAYT